MLPLVKNVSPYKNIGLGGEREPQIRVYAVSRVELVGSFDRE